MTSPLSRDELVAALGQEIDSPWTVFGKKPVVGHASRSRFWLVQRRGYRNSFQTVLTATLSDDGGGTRLSCRTGLSTFVIVFMCVWFGLTLIVTIPMTNIAIQNDDAWSLLFNAGFLAFGAVLVSLGRWLARGEHEFLVSFLEDVIDARG